MKCNRQGFSVVQTINIRIIVVFIFLKFIKNWVVNLYCTMHVCAWHFWDRSLCVNKYGSKVATLLNEILKLFSDVAEIDRNVWCIMKSNVCQRVKVVFITNCWMSQIYDIQNDKGRILPVAIIFSLYLPKYTNLRWC